MFMCPWQVYQVC